LKVLPHACGKRLELVSAMSEFDIASLHEMMALLAQADSSYAFAA